MQDAQWFEYDGELDEIQSAYVEFFRRRAVAWPLEPMDTYAQVSWPEDWVDPRPVRKRSGQLLVWIDLTDPGECLSLVTVGAYLQRDRVTGDELHNQLLTLPQEPTALRLAEYGDPTRLAEATAAWFEAIMRRPIAREEWLRRGKLYAQRWIFTDTNRVLVVSREYTPRLGPPDRVALVRGLMPERTDPDAADDAHRAPPRGFWSRVASRWTRRA